jgi:hypothetical protein
MKKWIVVTVVVVLAVMLVAFSVGCKKKSPVAAVVDTPTPLPAVTPVLFEDFEDDTIGAAPGQNLAGGSWSASAGNLMTGTYEVGSYGSSAKSLSITATAPNLAVGGNGWTSFATDVTPSAAAVNLKTLYKDAGYTGIRFKAKGSKGDAVNIGFLLQLPKVDPTVTDYSKYRTFFNVTSSWTTINCPWSGFVGGWGGSQASMQTIDQWLSAVYALEFAISQLDGAANCTNSLFIDDREFY